MNKKDQKKGMSRRNFAQLALAGIGVTSTAGLGALTSSTAHATEDEIQRNMAEAITTVEHPIHIDEKVFHRHDAGMNAFKLIGKINGKPWYEVYAEQKEKNMLEGKSATNNKVGMGLARSAAALRDSAAFLESHLDAGFSDGTNRGLLSWNPTEKTALNSRPPVNTDPDTLTTQVKAAARLAGANLVGISALNKNWIYRSCLADGTVKKDIVFRDVEKPGENDKEFIIPQKVNNVIVMAMEMPREMIQTSPSALAEAASAYGYARMGLDQIVVNYIRNEGYIAIPCQNNTGMSVPMAIEAGLGEAGRNGILITPQYGPSIRLTKILTDMPLNHDKAIKFGVEEFCNYCKKCARECPSKCITEDDQSWEPRSKCNNGGVLKWYNDYPKCLQYWIESGAECGNCISVCPFTKGDMWAHHFTEWSIKNVPQADPIWLGLDDAFGYGKQRKDEDVWDLINVFGLDPQKMK